MTTHSSQPRTILHISDLHFGRKFNHSKWEDLKFEANKAAPDLVLITGDLLNTPWFWMWSRVKSELGAFANDLRTKTNKPELQVRVIPGNHDTRISGVYPVQWLLWSALIFVAFAVICYLLHRTAVGTPWLALVLQGGSWVAGLLTVSAIVLRLLVSKDPERTLGKEFWLTEATLFPTLGIGVLPFDSASTKLSWARGHVPVDSLVKCKAAVQSQEEALLSPNSRPPVWLAAVHHHPLPLPYDSAHEHMMVMDNAGAFLRELARCNVKLVLHGHKHHQHFARIAVDPATSQGLEIAVLSAGTPTEGISAGNFRHGFNIIRVNSDDHLTVEIFEAEPDGGTFFSKQNFEVVPSEQHARAQFEQRQQRYELLCRRMVCIADINDYGDAHFVREFRGVKTQCERLSAFPTTLAAHASSGSIEDFRVSALSSHGPGVKFNIESQERNRITGRVMFNGSGLQRGEDPIDIMTEFQGNNAFALNRWQFDSMYPDRDDYLESVSFRAPESVAVNELVLHLQFPTTKGLPKRLDFRWREGGLGAKQWSSFKPQMLVRLESQNAVGARIMYPVPNAEYQINWDLQEAVPNNAKPATGSAIAGALKLRNWLAGLNSDGLPSHLVKVLDATEAWARKKLVVDNYGAQLLNYALYSYDNVKCQLRVVASNYHAEDERRNWVFQFGLGLPGRAFKTAEVAVFTRPFDWKSGRALGYMTGRATSAKDSPFEPEATILAIPLAPPEAPDWPFAVLQISTDEPTIRLHTVDTPTVKLLEEVIGAVQENLRDEFLSIMHAVPIRAKKEGQ